MEELIRFQHIEKWKKNKKQFSDISFALNAGQMDGLLSDDLRVQGILGKILQGEVLPDAGDVFVEDRHVTRAEAAHYFKRKVCCIDQTEKYPPELTVADLFFISPWKQMQSIYRQKKIQKEIRNLYASYGLIPPELDQKAVQLDKLERTIVTMLRAAACGARIFVLMGISGFLNQSDRDRLMELLTELIRQGAAALVMDHDRSLLLNYSQNLILLRNGMTEFFMAPNDENCMELLYPPIPLRTSKLNEEAKEVVFSMPHQSGEIRPFQICKGEIVGLVDNTSYKSESILSLLKGEISGTVMRLNQKEYTPVSYYDALHKGIAFVEEGFLPQENMFVESMTVLDNLVLTMSEKKLGFSVKRYRTILADQCKEFFGKEIGKKWVSELDLVERQRLVYFRWLLYFPTILVCVHPFLGSNLQMRRTTEEMIRMCADKGIAILIISNGMSEIYNFCDRVIVL